MQATRPAVFVLLATFAAAPLQCLAAGSTCLSQSRYAEAGFEATDDVEVVSGSEHLPALDFARLEFLQRLDPTGRPRKQHGFAVTARGRELLGALA
jgi:hypothetical protein